MKAFWMIILWAAGSAGFVQQTSAQRSYVLTSDSRMRIEGTSTIDSFTCEAREVTGFGVLQKPMYSGTRVSASAGEARLELTVPVTALDCGKDRMNHDLRAALNAGAYPSIEFRLDQIEVLEDEMPGGTVQHLRAVGRLRLAGSEQEVRLDVFGSALPDGRLRAQGAVDLLMTDFGISPPRALLGLVRAHDEITVRFDLYGARMAIADGSARREGGKTQEQLRVQAGHGK